MHGAMWWAQLLVVIVMSYASSREARQLTLTLHAYNCKAHAFFIVFFFRLTPASSDYTPNPAQPEYCAYRRITYFKAQDDYLATDCLKSLLPNQGNCY